MKRWHGIKDRVVFICILFFIVFYICKINGYFDFSGSDFIQNVSTNRNSYNIPLLLDGEMKTDWGTLECQEGDYLIITFRKEILIDSISMYSSPEARPAQIAFLYLEGEDWKDCDAKELQDNIWSFSPVVTTAVRIECRESNANHEWRIKELDCSVRENHEGQD